MWMRSAPQQIRDPQLILKYQALVSSVSAERIQAAARRYLDLNRYVIGILAPEAQSGSAPPAN